jgi:hypothetical protein
MNQYRLRIDELHNGTKKYYVQKMYLRIIKGWDPIGWTQRQEIVWEDFQLRPYSTEEAAMEVIKLLKEDDEEREGKQVKSTTYKDV